MGQGPGSTTATFKLGKITPEEQGGDKVSNHAPYVSTPDNVCHAKCSSLKSVSISGPFCVKSSDFSTMTGRPPDIDVQSDYFDDDFYYDEEFETECYSQCLEASSASNILSQSFSTSAQLHGEH